MKLLAWRKAAGLSRAKAAALIGISEMHLWRLEVGKGRPSSPLMERIYAVTGGAVTPNDFFDLERSPTHGKTPLPSRTVSE